MKPFRCDLWKRQTVYASVMRTGCAYFHKYIIYKLCQFVKWALGHILLTQKKLGDKCRLFFYKFY